MKGGCGKATLARALRKNNEMSETNYRPFRHAIVSSMTEACYVSSPPRATPIGLSLSGPYEQYEPFGRWRQTTRAPLLVFACRRLQQLRLRSANLVHRLSSTIRLHNQTHPTYTHSVPRRRRRRLRRSAPGAQSARQAPLKLTFCGHLPTN